MTISWINTTGGPLICAPYSAGRMWRGTRASSVGVEQSDYSRACDVEDYVGLVSCGSTYVVVLGDEPLQSAFVTTKTGLAIVRWVSCVSAQAAEVALGAIPPSLKQVEAPKPMMVEFKRLVLFDSAYSLGDAPGCVETEVQPGAYMISTESYIDPGTCEFLVHRLRQSDVA